MKRLITTLAVVFLCLKINAQSVIVAPQLSVSGNVGCVGFPCQNSGTLNFTADADQTMNALQSSAQGGLRIGSTTTLTATRTLTVPAGTFPFHVVENVTMGSQSIRLCSASGGGCLTIPNGQALSGVWYDGVNFIAGSSSGGGAVASVFGRTGAVIAQSGDYAVGQITGAAPLASPTFTGTVTLPSGQVVNGVTLTTGGGTTNFLRADGSYAAPTGSGNTTSTALGSNVVPKSNGANSIVQSSITDNGTTVSTTEPLSANGLTATATAGTAGIAALVGGATAPSIPANQFGFLGFPSGSATSYFLQPSTTAPNGNYLQCAAPVANVSQCTWASGGGGITSLTGDVTGAGSGAVATTLATVNSSPGSFGSATLTPVFTVNAKGLITAVSTVSTLAAPSVNYIFYPSTTSDGGSAFASGCTRYANNQPQVGSVNSAASALGYMAFQAAVGNQYCEFTRTEPPYWTGTTISVDSFSAATTGTNIWEIQSVCLGSSTVLSSSYSPTFTTTTALTITVSGTANTLQTTSASTVAAPGSGGCPASPTMPTQVTYRVYRSASDTATGNANLVGFNVGVGRSQ